MSDKVRQQAEAVLAEVDEVTAVVLPGTNRGHSRCTLGRGR